MQNRVDGPIQVVLAALGVCLALALAAPSTYGQSTSDSETLVQARKLVEAAHMLATAEQAMDVMEKPILNIIIASNPEKGEAAAEIMKEYFLPEIRGRIPELADKFAQLYAEHFSGDEIQQLVAFYESPIGRRLIEEQPAMLTDAAQIGNRWGQAIVLETLRKLAPVFEERGLVMPPI